MLQLDRFLHIACLFVSISVGMAIYAIFAPDQNFTLRILIHYLIRFVPKSHRALNNEGRFSQQKATVCKSQIKVKGPLALIRRPHDFVSHFQSSVHLRNTWQSPRACDK